jgi:hypothetical protein
MSLSPTPSASSRKRGIRSEEHDNRNSNFSSSGSDSAFTSRNARTFSIGSSGQNSTNSSIDGSISSQHQQQQQQQQNQQQQQQQQNQQQNQGYENDGVETPSKRLCYRGGIGGAASLSDLGGNNPLQLSTVYEQLHNITISPR